MTQRAYLVMAYIVMAYIVMVGILASPCDATVRRFPWLCLQENTGVELHNPFNHFFPRRQIVPFFSYPKTRESRQFPEKPQTMKQGKKNLLCFILPQPQKKKLKISRCPGVSRNLDEKQSACDGFKPLSSSDVRYARS